MIFTSLLYLAYLAGFAAILSLMPYRARFWACLAASYVFYASWDPSYLVLVFVTGTIGFAFGRRIARTSGSARKTWSWIGVSILLLVLVVFRTPPILDAIGSTLRRLLHLRASADPRPSAIPLGLSFYVFEAIGYLIECAKGKEPAYGFWEYQLFISFFPHLVAGPIMRAKELIPQFHRARPFVAGRVGSGIWWICSGLFLKIVLADQLSPKLDVWFAAPVSTLHALDVIVLALGFGLQMYLDFAGYSRIAVGSARCLGIDLVENFNWPFSAVSPPDFWNRWHISLSRWVRDYVFFPFVGRQRGLHRLCEAAIFSMILCGLWHGFGLKFLVWGLFHGLLIAGYHVFRSVRQRWRGGIASALSLNRERQIAVIGWATTQTLLLPGWILFRAETLPKAFAMLRALVTPSLLRDRAIEGNVYVHVFLLFVAVVSAPLLGQSLLRLVSGRADARWAIVSTGRALACGVVLAITFVYLGTRVSFVYFQF